MTTELEAVNRMLRTIGQVGVSTIPDGGQSDSRIALNILNDYTIELQQEGYDFNTDEKVELLTESDGTINIPSDALRVIPYYSGNRYTVRGGKLYDLDARSGVFQRPAWVHIIRRVPFESLPYPLQNYVIVRSARVFANTVIGAQEQNGYNAEDEARTRIAWLNTVSEDMQLNILSSSSHHRPSTFRPGHAITRGLY